jgi:hypothetical protein
MPASLGRRGRSTLLVISQPPVEGWRVVRTDPPVRAYCERVVSSNPGDGEFLLETYASGHRGQRREPPGTSPLPSPLLLTLFLLMVPKLMFWEVTRNDRETC